MQLWKYRVSLGFVIGGLLLVGPTLGWAACSAEAEQAYQQGTQVSRKYTTPGNPCEETCLEEKLYFYQRAVTLCPSHVKAHNNLGSVLEKLGRYAEAHTHYSRAIALDSDFAAAHFGLGDLYFHTEEYAKAIAAYDEGLRLEPKDKHAKVRQEQARCLKGKKVPPADCIQAVLGGEAITVMGVAGIVDDRRLPIRIPFALNKADLLPEARAPLHELGTALGRILAAHESAAFLIEGHTDVQGTVEHNLRLSEQRAQRVAQHLMEAHKISAERLGTKGYGKSRLLTLGRSKADHARNRRVEVSDLKKYVSVLPVGEAPGDASLRVDVGVFYEDAESRPQKLREGGVLHSGDGFRLYLEAHQPCYVYVFQIDSSRKLFHLYPNPEYGTRENWVPARAAYWVPARDKWFALDHTTGREEIYVVASRERREDMEDLIRRYLQAEQVGSTAGVLQEFEVTMKTMGVKEIRGDKHVKVVSRTGVAVELSPDQLVKAGVNLAYRFGFRHEEKRVKPK